VQAQNLTTSDTMADDSASILQQARQSDEPPKGWTVIPLDVREARRAVLGWFGSALLGVVLFALLYNTVKDSLNIFTLIVLAVLGFLAVGSGWLLARRAYQLMNADKFIIVMTPEQFVEQKGTKTIAVPMKAIENITLRGAFGGLEHAGYRDDDYRTGVITFQQMLGGRQSQRRRRTPDSLAFVDSNTGKVITIAEDNGFANLAVIEEILRTYVDNARHGMR